MSLAEGDEIRIGGTVLGVRRGAAATAIAPQQPRAIPDASPGRLAPDPHAEGNIPALAAVFLGPLSIFLLLFGGGAAFFVSLPMAIGAIVLGTMGRRRADAGEGQGALARIGRITGIVGTALSVLAIVAFIVASVVLDVTEDSLDGIVEGIRDEIEGVDVPDGVDVPAPN